MARRRFALIAVVAAALAALLTVGTWVSMRAPAAVGPAQGPGMMSGGYGPGMMGGAGMGGGYGLVGDGGRVDTLTAARQRAQAFADRPGLRAGEVIQFSNGFYAELLTADGAGATEVLVDPANGGVSVEYGPAIMWNTRYGMHPGGGRTGSGVGSRREPNRPAVAG